MIRGRGPVFVISPEGKGCDGGGGVLNGQRGGGKRVEE